MLIPMGKLYTAFNLTSDEMVEVLSLLPTPPVIPVAWLILDPKEQNSAEVTSSIPFTFDLAHEYAAHYASKATKIYPTRTRMLNLVLEHLVRMNQILEKDISDDEMTRIKNRWFDEKYNGIFSNFIGVTKQLADEIRDFLCGAYPFFAQVELEEAVLLMHEISYPLATEVKGLTRERYNSIVQNRTITPKWRGIGADMPQNESVMLKEAVLDTEMDSLPRGAIPSLLKAIETEATQHGLNSKHYVTTPRTIRNWLKKPSSAPAGFSRDILLSAEDMAIFAKKYIAAEVARGSSELAANAKREVAFNSQYHGVVPDTAEDAFMLAEAYSDYALTLPRGKETETRRKAKRKPL
jgi:hypothetical protein